MDLDFERAVLKDIEDYVLEKPHTKRVELAHFSSILSLNFNFQFFKFPNFIGDALDFLTCVSFLPSQCASFPAVEYFDRTSCMCPTHALTHLFRAANLRNTNAKPSRVLMHSTADLWLLLLVYMTT